VPFPLCPDCDCNPYECNDIDYDYEEEYDDDYENEYPDDYPVLDANEMFGFN
jgi:hypothetical protein